MVILSKYNITNERFTLWAIVLASILIVLYIQQISSSKTIYLQPLFLFLIIFIFCICLIIKLPLNIKSLLLVEKACKHKTTNVCVMLTICVCDKKKRLFQKACNCLWKALSMVCYVHRGNCACIFLKIFWNLLTFRIWLSSGKCL